METRKIRKNNNLSEVVILSTIFSILLSIHVHLVDFQFPTFPDRSSFIEVFIILEQITDKIAILFFVTYVLFRLTRYYIPITGNYFFCLRNLSWKTSATFQIYKSEGTDLDSAILNYLKNNERDEFKFETLILTDAISLYSTITTTNYLLPVSLNSLKGKVKLLLERNGLHGTYIKHNKPPKLKYYRVKLEKFNPDIPRIIQVLYENRYYGISVSQVCQFGSVKSLTRKELSSTNSTNHNYLYTVSKDNANERVNRNFYKVSLKIGLSENSQISVSQLKSLMNTENSDIVTRRFGIYRKNHELIGKEALKFIQPPKLDEFTYSGSLHDRSLPPNYQFQYKIGKIVRKGSIGQYVGISTLDFMKGGLIVGAIGNGKTTLRLHIIKLLLENNVQVIDFDLKGDINLYPELSKQGMVVTPKKNFYYNLFAPPKNYTKREYCEILTKILQESMDKKDLTPQQNWILSQAVQLTVFSEGNGFNFFKNIMIVSFQSKSVINNYQENSGIALLTKFAWIEKELGEIFWTNQESVDMDELTSHNIFFDLSELKKTTNMSLIITFVNLILCRFTEIAQLKRLQTEQNKPNTAIIIDEAQLLVPQNNDTRLSYIEEIITTLRYRGVSVVGIGVSSEKISDVLKDSGFIAQFQSESVKLSRALRLVGEEVHNITKLPAFHALISTKSINRRTIEVTLENFLPTTEKRGKPAIKTEKLCSNNHQLPNFNIDENLLIQCTVLTKFQDLLTIRSSLFNEVFNETIEIIEFAELINILIDKMSTTDLATTMLVLYSKYEKIDKQFLYQFPTIYVKIGLYHITCAFTYKTKSQGYNIPKNITTKASEIANEEFLQTRMKVFQLTNYSLTELIECAKNKNISRIKLSPDKNPPFIIFTKDEKTHSQKI